MIDIELNSIPCVSRHYLNRYIKLIKIFSNQDTSKFEYVEKHHILPVSMFPRYQNLHESGWNCVILSGRQHYIIHYVLAKAFGGKMWFAFNQMKRVISGSIKIGALYELTRKYISNEISKSNKGKIRTFDVKSQMSLYRSGHFYVKNKDGDIVRIKSSEFDNRHHIHLCTGKTHSVYTKKKMSMNGIKGKKAFSDSAGNVRYFTSHSSAESNGYSTIGNVSLRGIKPCVDTTWYNNPITGDEIRIKNGEDIPIGYSRGRSTSNTNVGFARLNCGEFKTMFDVIGKKFNSIRIEDIDPMIHIYHGGKNTRILVIDNLFFLPYKKDCIVSVFGFNIPYPESNTELQSVKIQKHGKGNNKKFIVKHSGLTYGDVGFSSMRIDEYINSDTILTRLTDIGMLNNIERFIDDKICRDE